MTPLEVIAAIGVYYYIGFTLLNEHRSFNSIVDNFWTVTLWLPLMVMVCVVSVWETITS